jgi:hypothetical protein
VLVPVFEGVPESLITIGSKYSFCCSLSNDDSEDTIATPSPFAPSVSGKATAMTKKKERGEEEED